VNRFARLFGGGGHAKAAGAMIAGTLEEVRDRVVDAAREFVPPRVEGRGVRGQSGVPRVSPLTPHPSD
jgi:hypothetical protein